jgi:uncharacterized membrane protein HdeD (DUF308 family)
LLIAFDNDQLAISTERQITYHLIAGEFPMPTMTIEQVGLTNIKRNWFWFLLMGIVLIVLGTMAIGRTCFFTKVSMVFIGWMMIAAGGAQALNSFINGRGWSGFFFDLITGILYLAVGFMIVANPASTAVTLTLVIALYLIIDGGSRLAGSFYAGLPNRGWVFLGGLVSLLLGISIWRQWPYSGTWVIGLFVGIQMIMNGWSTVMLSLAVKNIPDEEPPAKGASPA